MSTADKKSKVEEALLLAVTNDDMRFRGRILFREIEQALNANGFAIIETEQPADNVVVQLHYENNNF